VGYILTPHLGLSTEENIERGCVVQQHMKLRGMRLFFTRLTKKGSLQPPVFTEARGFLKTTHSGVKQVVRRPQRKMFFRRRSPYNFGAQHFVGAKPP